MVRITDTTVIDRPTEVVWRFISDPSNNLKWYSEELKRMLVKGGEGALAVRMIPEGPAQVGTLFAIDVQAFGRARPIRARCTVLIPNRSSTWESVSGITKGSVDSWQMEPEGGTATRLTRVYDLRVSGLWRLIQPVIARRTRRSHQAEMNNIQRILESEPRA